MDFTLLRKTALYSVVLMLFVVVFSVLQQGYKSTMASGSIEIFKLAKKEELVQIGKNIDTDKININVISDNFILNYRNKFIADKLKINDYKLLNRMGEKFIIIKKPQGKDIQIRIEELYVSRSLRFILENVDTPVVDNSYIYRINNESFFHGAPVYTEVESIETIDNGEKLYVSSKDYGNDFIRNLSFTNILKENGQLYNSEIFMELNSVYVPIIYEDNNYFYIDLKIPKDVYDKVLVIDAGHGGKDSGALSKVKGLYEKDINLDIMLRLKSLLDDENIKVYYTRKTDETIFLSPRVELANAVDSDFFISIHCNASTDPNPNGMEILYYDTKFKNIESKKLAAIVNEEIEKAIPLKNRGLVKKNKEDIYILNKAMIPAVLIEVGYLTNTTDISYLRKEGNRQAVAKGIYNSIIRAYQEFGFNTELN